MDIKKPDSRVPIAITRKVETETELNLDLHERNEIYSV